MDLPPPSPEQVIEQRLVDCGLTDSGFTVKYEDYLQSIEIVIGTEAGASANHFACIREAVGYEIVTFKDTELQIAYLDFQFEQLRPQMLESARTELEQRGLLSGFPERGSFQSLELYAQALETRAGLAPGSTLRVSGESLIFNPPMGDTDYADFAERYSGVLAEIRYAIAKGDFKNFSFIGNEKYQEPEDQ